MFLTSTPRVSQTRLVSLLHSTHQEIFYYTNCGAEVKNENSTSESLSLKVKDKGNQELVESLTGEGGPLQSGAVAGFQTHTETGQKNLGEAIHDAERMDQCLRKGAEARKYSISLQNTPYSSDLSSQMLEFSKKMEKLYKNVSDLVLKKVEDPEQYRKFWAVMDDKLGWFEKAEAGSTMLL
eukprot:Skav219491  [mRNA]  locus=scaffold937:158:1023:+ [translate_table: standard]